MLIDPDNPKELRAEANWKNKFGKTAADYAISAGHAKKLLPMLNDSVSFFFFFSFFLFFFFPFFSFSFSFSFFSWTEANIQLITNTALIQTLDGITPSFLSLICFFILFKIALQLKKAKKMGFDIDEADFKMATEFKKKDATRVKKLKKFQKEKKGNALSRLRKKLGVESKATIARLHQLQDQSARKIQGMVRSTWARMKMAGRMKAIVEEAYRKHLMERKKGIFIVKVQRGYRLKLARRYWRKRIVRHKAATKMTSLVRMFVARCFYLRRLEMIRVLKLVDRSATLIQCQARRMKAQLIVRMKKHHVAAAKIIQNFSKIVSAKRRARHKRWERDRHEVLVREQYLIFLLILLVLIGACCCRLSLFSFLTSVRSISIC